MNRLSIALITALIFGVLATTVGLAGATRNPKPVRDCIPDNIHTLRDLAWFTRHCSNVQEAEVTDRHRLPSATSTSDFVPPTVIPGSCFDCRSCGYPCPGEPTSAP